jgi:hypothetical protein
VSGTAAPDDVRRLRAAFVKLVAFEIAAGVAAMALLIGYFGLRLSWCLPAFAAVLAAAAAAQIVFIGLFRKSFTGGA